ERLSRGYERAFLENVGPLAVSGLSRRIKSRAPTAKKRRRTIVTHEPTSIEAPPAAPPADLRPSAVSVEGSPVVAGRVAGFGVPLEPEAPPAAARTRAGA